MEEIGRPPSFDPARFSQTMTLNMYKGLGIGIGYTNQCLLLLLCYSDAHKYGGTDFYLDSLNINDLPRHLISMEERIFPLGYNNG